MKWLRNILKGLSLTAALFVFQACYGTPAIDETLNPYEAAEQVEIDETPEAETAAEPESTPEQ